MKRHTLMCQSARGILAENAVAPFAFECGFCKRVFEQTHDEAKQAETRKQEWGALRTVLGLGAPR